MAQQNVNIAFLVLGEGLHYKSDAFLDEFLGFERKGTGAEETVTLIFVNKPDRELTPAQSKEFLYALGIETRLTQPPPLAGVKLPPHLKPQ
jgi:hypothetical protein